MPNQRGALAGFDTGSTAYDVGNAPPARHSDYDEFVPRKAEPSVEAAKRIIFTYTPRNRSVQEEGGSRAWRRE
jgi:hypothetical protein